MEAFLFYSLHVETGEVWKEERHKINHIHHYALPCRRKKIRDVVDLAVKYGNGRRAIGRFCTHFAGFSIKAYIIGHGMFPLEVGPGMGTVIVADASNHG